MTKSEWKKVAILKEEVLQRLCQKLLDGFQYSLANGKGTPHENYLKFYKQVHRKDKMIAECFDDWSKRNVWIKIRFWIKYQLITQEEFDLLPEELVSLIEFPENYEFYKKG